MAALSDFEIFDDEPDRPYRVIGPIRVRVGAGTIVSKAPTLEDVNFKLREAAFKKGANAVVGVRYSRGIGMTWKELTAKGTAVVMESIDRPCPFCAEPIRRAAVKCKHCGSDVSPDLSNLPPPPSSI
jgi:hypothetical protein